MITPAPRYFYLEIQSTLTMKLLLRTLIAFAAISACHQASAQCPTSVGILGTPMSDNTGCFMKITDAIPNSVVKLYNASGQVTQGVANSSGTVIISYNCANNPITRISSEDTSSTPTSCNEYAFAPMTTLPVKLSTFNASLNDRKQVVLKWQTAFEITNDRFEIQKSVNGSGFSTLAVQPGSGNSYEVKSYSFTDISFSPGDVAFYRLKQVDQDNQVTYSRILYVDDKAMPGSAISLFPNPQTASDNVIQLRGVRAGEISYANLRIFDLAGRSISYRITGPNSVEPYPALAEGIYMVQLKDKVLRLIKQL